MKQKPFLIRHNLIKWAYIELYCCYFLKYLAESPEDWINLLIFFCGYLITLILTTSRYEELQRIKSNVLFIDEGFLVFFQPYFQVTASLSKIYGITLVAWGPQLFFFLLKSGIYVFKNAEELCKDFCGAKHASYLSR